MTVIHERSIAAPPEIVYDCSTDPTEIVRWLAATAEVDPVPGGAVRWTHENGRTVSGHFVELVAPRRIVFTYGWTDGWLGVPAGSTTVEVDLVADTTGTRLRLTHRGLHAEAESNHRAGWTHFLDLLQAAAPTFTTEETT